MIKFGKTYRNGGIAAGLMLLMVFLIFEFLHAAQNQATVIQPNKPVISAKDNTQPQVLGTNTGTQTATPTTTGTDGRTSNNVVQIARAPSPSAPGSNTPSSTGGDSTNPAPEPAATDQGIAGAALYGPTSELCFETSSCYLPYTGTIVVSNGSGIITTFTPDDQGNFKVSLPAGTYTFAPQELLRLRGGYPSATVSVGIYSHSDIYFDTGLR